MKRLVCLCLMLVVVVAAHAVRAADVKIDADFSGGNIILDGIEGDTVRLRPDLRDTNGTWFYWAFRVRGAQGRQLEFVFTQMQPIGVRGPALSLDDGLTWKWLGRENATNSRFTYAFAGSSNSVLFSVAMPYTQANLDAFLKRVGDNRALRIETLTTSRKGRRVERLHLAQADAQPRHRMLIMARHHACEMMASYAVEGVMEAALADDEAGRWYRQNIELVVLPFVDKDGVEDGDQGRNRKPRDHNRDYSGESVHAETAAIRQWAPQWAAGKLIVVVDVHCPALRGPRNEAIYQPGKAEPRLWQEQQRFAAALQRSIAGELPYDPADDLPFGREWNTDKNFAQGETSTSWFGKIPGVKLSTTIELPYANARGKEVNQQSARAFGHDLAKALRDYVERDHVQRDQVRHDQVQRDDVRRDDVRRDHVQRDQVQRDQLQRDQVQRDQVQRDQVQRDQVQRDQVQRDHVQRDHVQRDHVRPESP